MAREPFAEASQQLLELSERNEISAVVSAISFNNIYYIVRKNRSALMARDCIKQLRSIVGIVEVDAKILNQALDSDIKDFEDAIQYFSSIRSGSSHLITRNPADFPSTESVTIATPEVFLSFWKAKN